MIHLNFGTYTYMTRFEKTRLSHTFDLMTLTNHNLLLQSTRRLKFSDLIFIRHKNDLSKFQSFSTLPQ